MVTIRDIATHLGLGKSTVQRALIGHAGISQSTREKVLKAAADLGYRPDPLFSILGSQSRQSRTRSLALAYLDRDEFSRSGDLTAGISGYNMAIQRGEELGYNIEHLRPSDLDAGKRLMDVLYHRGYAGVIIGQLRSPDHAAILANTHLPVVCCGRIDPLPLHTVQPDIVQMVRLAWSHMRQAGYKRIGASFGLHTPPIADDWERIGTAMACQQETLDKKDRVPPYMGCLRVPQTLVDWFHQHKPEAVIGFSIRQYYDLRDNGIDMSKVAFATLHTSANPGPTTIAGIVEANCVARESVNLLDQLIRHRNVGIPSEPLRILVPGHWQAGDSLWQRKTGPQISS
ncbi:MAG: LacI family DNA-binding transcriptional regulator [Candidatus Methylacidiphilales bacterium]|nr:LacI family DNA-binding transcriptional regulator [Candidatus Methylacidiphilales bacterium]